VELLIVALEPAPAAGAQGSRFFDFAQAENRAIEFASRVVVALGAVNWTWSMRVITVFLPD
jgi:hypothetical protein